MSACGGGPNACGDTDCISCYPQHYGMSVEDAVTQLKTLVDGQAVIIAEMVEHLAILRTGIMYMLMQAQSDEVDQTVEGNPWLKLRKDFAALLNPHIRRLNQLMGIKAEDVKEPPKIAVVTK